MWAKLQDVPYEEARHLSFQFLHQLCKLTIRPQVEDGDILNNVVLT